MEAMLGISLYSYPYSQLAKTLCLSYYAYVFSSTKLEIRAEQVLPGNKGGWWGEGVVGNRGKEWPKQCMHM
jgi:hypothetical protein